MQEKINIFFKNMFILNNLITFVSPKDLKFCISIDMKSYDSNITLNSCFVNFNNKTVLSLLKLKKEINNDCKSGNKIFEFCLL
jgi:hypothetical protein